MTRIYFQAAPVGDVVTALGPMNIYLLGLAAALFLSYMVMQRI